LLKYFNKKVEEIQTKEITFSWTLKREHLSDLHGGIIITAFIAKVQKLLLHRVKVLNFVQMVNGFSSLSIPIPGELIF